MRCPKCGYISFDHIESCLKCKKDISGSTSVAGTTYHAAAPSFLRVPDKNSPPEPDPVDEDSGTISMGEDYAEDDYDFSDPDLDILVDEDESEEGTAFATQDSDNDFLLEPESDGESEDGFDFDLDDGDDFDFSEDEDITVNIAEYSSDIDGDELSLSALSDTLLLDIEGMQLTVSALPDWNGAATVEVIVSDVEGAFATGILEIIVDPVNDYPVIELPASFSFPEDDQLEINLSDYCYDVDNDDLSYTVSSEMILTELIGTSLTLSAPSDWYGSEVIAIEVDDGQARVESSDLTTIIVTPVNDPPWIDLPDSLEIQQGESITLDINTMSGDIDSEELFLEVISINIGSNIMGMTVTLTAPTAWYGEEEVIISLSDESNTVSDTIFVCIPSEFITLNYDLVQNWNWISFNTLPAENSVENVLVSLNGFAEQIKGQNASTTWFDGYGWIGQLTELEPGKMYLLKMTADFNNFEVTGIPADSSLQIPLNINWNWIGHLPQENWSIIDVLSPIEPYALQIKAQNYSSTWFENYGWVGQLTEMEAGEGYKLKMTQPDTLIYQNRRIETNIAENNAYRLRWLPETGFEYNMTLMGEIIVEGLENELIRNLSDLNLFVELDDDIRFIRRMLRDLNERGRSLESIITQYQNTVKPMFHKHIKPTKRYADVIIPNDRKHDIAVDLIVTKIKQFLKEPA